MSFTLSLPKARRILRSAEFKHIYSTGQRITSKYFAAFCLPSDIPSEEPSRFGFTTPRALGKAVLRNRLRRRMRQAVRIEMPLLPMNWSIVFNPRRASEDVPFEELCREVRRVFTRCGRS